MIFFKLLEPLGADFVVYFEAAKMFLAGLNPYARLITRTFPYNYPPTSLLFLWPLAFWDYKTANIVWNILSTLSVAISIWLVLKIASLKLSRNLLFYCFIVLLFLFTIPFFPIKFNIGNGQINHFVLLFSALGLHLYAKKHLNISAFFLAFAAGIKIAPAIFLLYFLIRKDVRQIFRFSFFLAVLFLVSLYFIPWSIQREYFFNVLPLSFTLAAKDWYYNQSLFGFLARSLSNPITIQLSYYLLSLLILFLTWWRGGKVSPLRALAAVSSLYLMLHPIALQHYFGFAIIPWILLLSRRDWLPLAVAYVLLAIDIKNFNVVPTEFKFLLSHDLFGIFVLWVLALWREKFWVILACLWSGVIALAYLFMLLCRGQICF